MRYNRLGQTGLAVSELCLGAMTFGNQPSGIFQHDLDQDGSTALVGQAIDAGINFIDTANLYTGGQSEEFVGGALRSLGIARDQIVIATKGMGPMGSGPNDGGAGRYHLLHQIDASLARLGLDHVDLYQIHGWDPHCGMEETLRALEDIVRSGRARYVGVSNWAAWQITKALGICDRRGWDKFVSLQALYTAANRELERELVPMLRSEGLGLMVWSPLAGGLLSGKYARGEGDAATGEGRRAKLDFPRTDNAPDGRSTLGLGRGGGDRLAAAPGRGLERDRRRPSAGPAGSKHRRQRHRTDGRGTRHARWHRRAGG
jgi:aryl-alcohol dehydrogenase-like predicted oxidoreductase